MPPTANVHPAPETHRARWPGHLEQPDLGQHLQVLKQHEALQLSLLLPLRKPEQHLWKPVEQPPQVPEQHEARQLSSSLPLHEPQQYQQELEPEQRLHGPEQRRCQLTLPPSP